MDLKYVVRQRQRGTVSATKHGVSTKYQLRPVFTVLCTERLFLELVLLRSCSGIPIRSCAAVRHSRILVTSDSLSKLYL